MERVPKGKYTKESRVESMKLVTEDGLSVVEAGRRLSLWRLPLIPNESR